jgi:histidinol phosphatase-like enzyme (inositol monophosphatase family)
MPIDPEIQSRLEFARRAAQEARGVIMRHFSSAGGTRFNIKPDGTPVTVADVGAEELVRDLITKSWAQDGVLGEECGHTPGNSGFRWVIDPIDGTKSFIHGVPLFGTLIGIQQRVQSREVDGRDARPTEGEWVSVAGVANFPAMDECAWGALGGGAWYQHRDEPARAVGASAVSRLADATISTTSPRAMMEPAHLAFYQRLNKACKLSRGWSDCYGTLLVVTGRIEVMIDTPMKLWDVAALEPIVIEAGGRLTGWDGKPTDGSTGAIATNGLVHDEVIGLVG